MTKKRSFVLASMAVVVFVLLGTLLVLHLPDSSSSSSANSVHRSPTYCDGSGDNQPANDCVQMKLHASKANPKVAGGTPYDIQLVTHPGLRTKPMIAEVQYRSVSNNGKVGSWWGHKQVLLGSGSETTDVHNLTACAPVAPGTYQVRAAVWVGNTNTSVHSSTASSFLHNANQANLTSFDSAAKLTAASSTSTITPGAIVTSAPATLTATPGSASCQNTPEDEGLIEYFNQIEFSSEIQVLVTDTGTAYQVQISCPPAVSPSIPGPAFDLTMMTSSGSASTSCATNASPIVIEKQTLAQQTFCNQTSTCEFMIDFTNSQTGAVFSETIVQILLIPGNQTYIPNLEPAALPLCPENFPPCVLSGQCALGDSKFGQLSLCDSAASETCTPPTPTNTYSYNENVYFQSSISNPVSQ